ncbi:MAG: accessory gene regulator B family protein [Bacillota bacterium]|nr:accessory gene regulator B family protein [Bacillota bacterium]
MIDKISVFITKIIRENREISDESVEIISYGTSILIFQLLITLVVFLFALIFGVFLYAVVSFIIIGLLRTAAGGAHSSTRIQCVSLHTLSIFGSIFISKYIIFNSYFPSILIFLFNLIIAYKYAPGETIDGPAYNKKQQKIMKAFTICLIITFFLRSIIVWNHDKILHYVILISSLIPILILSPAGYFLLKCKRREPRLDY